MDHLYGQNFLIQLFTVFLKKLKPKQRKQFKKELRKTLKFIHIDEMFNCKMGASKGEEMIAICVMYQYISICINMFQYVSIYFNMFQYVSICFNMY